MRGDTRVDLADRHTRCGGLHPLTQMSQANSCASRWLRFAFQCILPFSTVAFALPLNAQGNITPRVTGGPRDSVPVRDSGELGDLLRLADSVSPSILAARARVGAARARVGPAAAWPDPMLMAGIQNLPLGKMNSSGTSMSSLPGDDMTMKMIGVSQTIPYPGKSGIRRRVAEREVEAAITAVRAASLDVARDVKSPFTSSPIWIAR